MRNSITKEKKKDDQHEIYYKGAKNKEEISKELKEIYENIDTAYISYLKSRKKIKEFILASIPS